MKKKSKENFFLKFNFKEIVKKILEIKKHNQHYYQYDAPKISDREYDLL